MARARTRDKAPVTTAQQLGSLIKSSRDIMRKDKGLNGDLDRLPMLTWVMFLKFLDDLEQIRETEALMAGEPFHPAIEPPYRWRDWAAKLDGITGDELIAFINNDEAVRPDGTRGPGLFAYLRSLQGTDGTRDRRDVIATVFRGVVNRMINGYLLRDVINKVNGIHFTSSEEVHTLSHLYEAMLKEMRDAAGDSGEFYTPRPVVRLMVAVTDPRLGETVLDPACGTGGFLVETFEHMKQQCRTVEDQQRLQRGSVLGVEAKPLPYLLCQMNLLLHGLEAPEIDPGNALRFPLREIGDRDRVDVILTNPPFGGEEEPGIQNNFPEDMRTSETALLFLQLIMRKLRRPGPDGRGGGRCAIVVPNGVLFGDGVCARIKKHLLEDFNLHTVVRLPNGVFAPYTPIPTNLLFFERSGPTREIWYYEHPLPEGRKAYTKTKPLQYEEFAPLLEWWGGRERQGRTENERAWRVPVEQVVANGYNLDVKNPNAKRDYEHLPPQELVEDILKKEQRIVELLQEIKEMLAGWERLIPSDLHQYLVRIGDADLSMNRESRNPVVTDPDGEFKYVDIASVARGPSTLRTARVLRGSEAPSRARRVVHQNDVIFSTVRPYLRAIAKIGEELDNQICSTGFAVFSCGPSIDPDFLLYQLCSPFFVEQCMARTTGGHYPAINDTNLRELLIVSPPKSKQQQIVLSLCSLHESLEGKVQLIKDLLAEAVVELDAIVPSVLDAVFRISDIASPRKDGSKQ